MKTRRRKCSSNSSLMLTRRGMEAKGKKETKNIQLNVIRIFPPERNDFFSSSLLFVAIRQRKTKSLDLNLRTTEEDLLLIQMEFSRRTHKQKILSQIEFFLFRFPICTNPNENRELDRATNTEIEKRYGEERNFLLFQEFRMIFFFG